MSYKTESWGKRGHVRVSRDSKGRFVSWKPIVKPYSHSFTKEYGEKQVSIYGQASNGIGERYDFYGSGRDLYRAIRFAHNFVPKARFVSVSAREFLSHPWRYGEWEFWVDREIES